MAALHFFNNSRTNITVFFSVAGSQSKLNTSFLGVSCDFICNDLLCSKLDKQQCFVDDKVFL